MQPVRVLKMPFAQGAGLPQQGDDFFLGGNQFHEANSC
jgi:hypothetical protein